MGKQEPPELLKEVYDTAMVSVGSSDTITSDLAQGEKDLLDAVLENSENATGALAVIITSLTYKILNPLQDVRKHQTSIAGGYSGRTFDNKYITPFMKACKFPAMAESGWLTRSLEQKVAYDKNYPGAITPKSFKPVFLEIFERIENNAEAKKYLSYLFQGLIIQRNKHTINLAKPTTLTIETILSVLGKHFFGKYTSDGASRLPVLAIYAAYQCLIKEIKRFENKTLLEIESHTSSDKSSGRIGDIEVADEKSRAFEAVEVKHGITITADIINTAYEKFSITPVTRYYILSTGKPPDDAEWKNIEEIVHSIKQKHGCQVIVNGIMHSIRYYLRMLDNTYDFVDNYTNLLENDAALKFEHKERWNQIISSLA